MMTTVW